MKKLLLCLLLIFPSLLYSQTTFSYNYTEVCSGRTNTVKVVLNNNSDFFTVFFFGESRTFSRGEYNSGVYADWMDQVYKSWSQYYPCAELLALVQETSKKVASKNSKEVVQPVIIVSSDLAFFSPSDLRVGGGWSEANLITKRSVGALTSLGTGKVYSFGYFRLTPVTLRTNSVENYNIIHVEANWLGNLINGVYYNYKGDGAVVFNSITFGNMNGFAFQNNGVMLGGVSDIYKNNQLNLKGLLVVSYTYYEKVFKLDYWFDNAMRINPNVTLNYQVSPTFGFSVTSGLTYRVGKDPQLINFGILTGAKLFF